MVHSATCRAVHGDRLHPPGLACQGRRGQLGPHPQLSEDGTDLAAHGGDGHVGCTGDVVDGSTAAQGPQHLRLAGRELLERGEAFLRLRLVTPQSSQMLLALMAVQQRAGRQHRPHRLDQVTEREDLVDDPHGPCAHAPCEPEWVGHTRDHERLRALLLECGKQVQGITTVPEVEVQQDQVRLVLVDAGREVTTRLRVEDGHVEALPLQGRGDRLREESVVLDHGQPGCHALPHMDDDRITPAGLAGTMSPPTSSPDPVAVAVAPWLLADGLATVLARRGVEVVHVGADTHGHFAVAIATPGAPVVSADVLVELGNGPAGTAVATARTPAGGPLVQLDGLDAIVDFVRSLAVGSLEVPDGQR